jgi:hypothetical protein
MRSILVIALAGGLLSACGEASSRANAEPAQTRTLASAEAALSDADMVRVCEAASEFVEKRELTVEASARNAPESVYLTLSPNPDRAQWTVQCRVEGEQLVWHVAEVEGPSGVLPQVVADRSAEVLGYSLNAGTVEITPAG